MNNLYKRLLHIALLFMLAIGTMPAKAQLGDVGEILQAGAADANVLAGEYLEPVGVAFGTALNTGWVTSAGAKGFPGFSLQLRLVGVTVPTSAQMFSTQGLNFQRLEQTNSVVESPTILGEGVSQAQRAQFGIVENDPITGQPITIASFTMPDGIDVPAVPSAMIQGTLGLFFDTDISLRYLPETKITDDFGSMSLIGASVRHGLNQWLPVPLPVDIAAQVGFTEFALDTDLSVTPADVGATGTSVKNTYNATHWDGQALEFTSSAWTANVLVGKQLNLLVIGIGAYAGLGIEGSTTTIATPGNYPILSVNTNTAEYIAGQTEVVESISDPLDLEFQGENNIRFIAGARFDLAIFKVFAEYTASNYSTINVGFAVGLF